MESLLQYSGTCSICGCTENNACVDVDYGTCWWANEEQTLCSHCAPSSVEGSLAFLKSIDEEISEDLVGLQRLQVQLTDDQLISLTKYIKLVSDNPLPVYNQGEWGDDWNNIDSLHHVLVNFSDKVIQNNQLDLNVDTAWALVNFLSSDSSEISDKQQDETLFNDYRGLGLLFFNALDELLDLDFPSELFFYTEYNYGTLEREIVLVDPNSNPLDILKKKTNKKIEP